MASLPTKGACSDAARSSSASVSGSLERGPPGIRLAAGTELKVVQEALGHATISVTADVYAHLLPPLKKDAAQRRDDAVRGPSEIPWLSVGVSTWTAGLLFGNVTVEFRI